MFHLNTYWPLLLLITVPLLWLIDKQKPGGAGWRGTITLVLTAATLCCFIIALTQITWQKREKTLSLVFVVDLSASISDVQRQQMRRVIQQTIESLQDTDRYAIVGFGEDASVELGWSTTETSIDEWKSTAPGEQASHLEDGLRTAADLLTDGVGRILLLSDGNQNVGDAEQILPLLRARGIDIDVWPLRRSEEPEVILTQLHYPKEVAEGRRIPLKLMVTSTEPTELEVQIKQENLLVEHDTVSIDSGRQLLNFLLPPADAGQHRYQVTLIPQADTLAVNNVAVAQIRVAGRPRVIYVTSASRDPFYQAVPDMERLAPSRLSHDATEYTAYDVLVLDNVPAEAIRESAMEAIEMAVRVGGLGLVVLGSQSLGPGGYLDTTLEPILPVELTPPEKQSPKTIVFVVDRSGSMGAKVGADPKIRLARSAVATAIRALRPEDWIGVIAFDAQPHELVPLSPVGKSEKWLPLLGQLDAGHGTFMQTALEQAERWFESATTERKFLVIVSDGRIGEDDSPLEVVERLAQRDVQTSAISLGPNVLMQQLGQSGNGRYHVVSDIRTLPRILVEEMKRPEESLRTGTYTPRIKDPHPILAGLTEWPPIYGYISTQLRARAQAPLVVANGQPLLAAWRYGAGRVAVFNSDLAILWGREWVRWPNLRKFCQQLVDWTIPEPLSESLAVELRGSEARIVSGQKAPSEAVVGRPSGETQSVPFHMDGGQWVGTFTVDEAGDYLIAVGDERMLLPVAYPPEWGALGTDEPFLRRIAIQTGGRFAPSVEDVARRTYIAHLQTRPLWRFFLWLGIGFFLLNLAARRISLTNLLPQKHRDRAETSIRTLTHLQKQRRTPHSVSITDTTVRMETPAGLQRASSTDVPLASQLLSLKRDHM